MIKDKTIQLIFDFIFILNFFSTSFILYYIFGLFHNNILDNVLGDISLFLSYYINLLCLFLYNILRLSSLCNV